MFRKDLIKDVMQDKVGQVFSLDAMLALIIITVTIGLSANAMDLVNFQISDYSSEKFLNRITVDAATALINTPGSPDNWEINNLSGITPGLAEVDSEGKIVPNTLSIKKICVLQSAYSERMDGKIIPHGTHSNVVIYPADSSLNPIVLSNETPPEDAVEVAVVNRTVLCDFMVLKTLIIINTSGSSSNSENRSFADVCPHKTLKMEMEHQNNNLNYGDSLWACQYFRISQEDLNSTDFYIITDPETGGGTSNQWIMDKTDNMTNERQNFNSGPIFINNKISQVLGQDKKAVLWLHVTFTSSTPSFGVYLVGAPKGTPIENVKMEYVNPRPCFFVLKVWR
jgi:hypothetical protein